ncbi:MAG: SxtJ family membrane protein [Chthoniobacterales bacterium]
MNWLKEEFHQLDRSPKALARFGFILGGIAILLGLLLLVRHRSGNLTVLSGQVLGVLLVIMAVVAPRALKYLHAVWIGLSLLIGWVMTRVILTLVFLLVVTPIGLLQRLASRSSVDLRGRTGAASYWQPRQKTFAPADYRNQF